MKRKYQEKPETYNFIVRKLHPEWAGWRVIDEQKNKDDFPNNLINRYDILDDLEYSYFLNIKNHI